MRHVLLAATLALLAGCGPALRPAGPAVREPALVEGALIARDGARLPLERWSPAEAPRAQILALHGYGDFRLSFEEAGRFFAGRGVALYAYDQRGFGEAPDFGYWPGAEALVDDLADAIEAVRAQAPERPLYLLGESMGGAVILALMGRPEAPEVKGLLLAAPGVREGVRLRYVWDALMWTAARVAPGVTYTVEREEEPRLSEAARRRLAQDPRVVREVRADAYDGLLDLSDEASAAAYRVRAPTLIQHGDADWFVKRVSICAAFQALRGPREGLAYADAPHLILQWREAERVLTDMAEWIEDGEVGPTALARPLAELCG